MAAPLHKVRSLRGLGGTLVALLILLPVLFGLGHSVMAGFGHLPVLGVKGPSLSPWQTLLAQPGLWRSVILSLWTGMAATVLSLILAFGAIAALQGHAPRLRRVLAPLLAVPHAALAIGLAFVIAPSGWIARLLAPVLDWSRPPDVTTLGDPWGLALILGLMLKETPFLIAILLAASSQIPLRAQMAAARALGYGARGGLVVVAGAATGPPDPVAGPGGAGLFGVGRGHGADPWPVEPAHPVRDGIAAVHRPRPARDAARLGGGADAAWADRAGGRDPVGGDAAGPVVRTRDAAPWCPLARSGSRLGRARRDAGPAAGSCGPCRCDAGRMVDRVFMALARSVARPAVACHMAAAIGLATGCADRAVDRAGRDRNRDAAGCAVAGGAATAPVAPACRAGCARRSRCRWSCRSCRS
ncbi:hypothetical protein [Paracoccus homiensis]|uniref:hypothetical protein n=1 Tax=Paracoccus homiensis TaxID=364199 RepID=UPI00398D6112